MLTEKELNELKPPPIYYRIMVDDNKLKIIKTNCFNEYKYEGMFFLNKMFNTKEEAQHTIETIGSVIFAGYCKDMVTVVKCLNNLL